MMERRHFVQCGGLLLAVQLVGCGGEDGDEGESSTGGTNHGTGGDTTATGGAPSGTGGAPSGGATASGGADATGGADPGSGGDTASGGDTSSGGDGNVDENACMGGLEGEHSNAPEHTTGGTPHAHSYKLSEDELASTEDITFVLTDGHDHDVTLTADHLATLRSGGAVEVTSGPSGGGHTHTFEISCV